MRPLGLLIVLLAGATLTAFFINNAGWVAILFGSLTVAVIIAYLIAYFYLLKNDRDCLRSETYTIQKMAIERGFIGDDQLGVIDLDDSATMKLIDSKPSVAIDASNTQGNQLK